MDVNKNIYNTKESIKGLVDVDKNEIKRYNVKPNDLFFTRTSETSDEIGLTSAYTGELMDCVFSGFILRARPIKEDINSLFFAYYLRSDKSRSNIIKYSSITTRALISGSNLYKMKVRMPKIDEQNKIAGFLSAIDKKIELLEKKLVLCRKTIDFNVRKIYSDIEEYDEIKLNEIVKSYSSNLSINKLEENIGEYPLYGAEGIIKYVDFYEMKSPYISIIKDGAGVGRLNLCNEFSSALGTLQCLIPNQDININFLYFYLKTLNFNKYIVGSTIPHIYFKDYSKERIKVTSLKRQQDIGNYFSLYEKKNNMIKEEIEILNKFKQGLLQKMFV